ncbi:MAG: hypothetical protein M1530_01540 [Candidatus Marsarchaeota archaeon]|nr:hypothetical protein [Candidatus Marsarchaeota archaeon]
MGEDRRGVTGVEFLVLLAGLLVLALLLTQLLGIVPIQSNRIAESKAYWSAQAYPVKITDWTLRVVNQTDAYGVERTEANLSLVLLNPTREPLVLRAISLGPGNFSEVYDYNTGEWLGPVGSLNLRLESGAQKAIIVQHWRVGSESAWPASDRFEAENTYQFDVQFTYSGALGAPSGAAGGPETTITIQSGSLPLVGSTQYAPGNLSGTCPPGLDACGASGTCCESGRCCDGTCWSPSMGSCNAQCTCCPLGQTPCDSACCSSGQVCVDGACQTAACNAPDIACGDWCCARGGRCVDPSAPIYSQACADSGACPLGSSACGTDYCCNDANETCGDPNATSRELACQMLGVSCPTTPVNRYCPLDLLNGPCCAVGSQCVAGTCTSVNCSAGQTQCNSTDGTRSSCCDAGEGCANLTGTCCDASSSSLLFPITLCNYTNLTGSFSACCTGLDCDDTIGCCVAAGNPCNESLGMYCCDGSACPANGICECNEEAPCCMNQEGGWCNSTDPNVELSCCAASGLLCDLATNSCYLNSSSPCVGDGTPYRALNNSWLCCYPDNQTYGTGYIAPPFPEERQICCEPGSSICGTEADSVCCPSGSCSSGGVCCDENLTNAACGTGYLITECCSGGLNCTNGTPYDACCNPTTTADVCNDPTNGMTCCNNTCLDGPVAGLAAYQSVCCQAPNNTAVCDGPECCSAPCIENGGDSVCCPGAGELPPTQFVCYDSSCCNNTCSDRVGIGPVSNYTCCPSENDEVCTNNECCNSTEGKTCVDENGLQLGSTACCPAGVVSCGGSCCNVGESCTTDSQTGNKSCCPPGTDFWGGVCCNSTNGAQKTVGGQHICCDPDEGKVLDDLGTCCYDVGQRPLGQLGQEITPYNKSDCTEGKLCCSSGTSACAQACTNQTPVCCDTCHPPTECGAICEYQVCCANNQDYCNSMTRGTTCCTALENCLSGGGQQECCPAGDTDFCKDSEGFDVCCGPSTGGTAVGKDDTPYIQGGDNICCPAALLPQSFCTGDGQCCPHACSIDSATGEGYCCANPAEQVCNLTSGGVGCCAAPNLPAPIDAGAGNMCCPAGSLAYCSFNGTADGCCANACSSLTVGSTTNYACCSPGDSLTCGDTLVTSCVSMTCCATPSDAVSSFTAPPTVTVVATKECCADGSTGIAVDSSGGYECCGADGTAIVSDTYMDNQGTTSYNCCPAGVQSCDMQCCGAASDECTLGSGQCCAPNSTSYRFGGGYSGAAWNCCSAGQIPMNSSSGECCGPSSTHFVCVNENNHNIQSCCVYGQGCDTSTGNCVGGGGGGCPAGFGCEGGVCVYHCPNGQDYTSGSC